MRTATSYTAHLPRARWAALGALLVAEAMLMAAVFDPVLVPGFPERWWTSLLSHGGWVIPLVTAVTAATWLLGEGAVRSELTRISPEATRPRRWWTLLVGHLIALGFVVRLTAFVFGPELAASTQPGLWVLAWAGSALITGGLLLACAIPAGVVWSVVAHLRGPLLAGGSVGILAFAAGKLTEGWWLPLRQSTFDVVAAILRLVVDDPVSRPAEYVLGTREFLVEITALCSGYQGIGLIWVFLLAFLWFFRRALRFPHALVLLPLGTIIVFLANAIRIAALVLIGAFGWPQVALGGFHAQTGSLLFCSIALGLAFVARRSRFLAADWTATRQSGATPTMAYVGPFVLVTATALFTGIFSDGGTNHLYPARIAVALGALWTLRRQYEDSAWRWSWVGLGAGVIACGLWLSLVLTDAAAATSPGLGAPESAWGAIWTVFRLGGFVLVVPVVEELAFRGYLMRRFVALEFERVQLRDVGWLAVGASSLLFGVMHERVLAATIAGVLYALAARHQGRLGDAVVAHVTTNLLLVVYAVATGQWFVI